MGGWFTKIHPDLALIIRWHGLVGGWVGESVTCRFSFSLWAVWACRFQSCRPKNSMTWAWVGRGEASSSVFGGWVGRWVG